MAAFRAQRLAGDYCFRFRLIHKPWRARNIYYHGIMWGSWNDQGPVTRILVYSQPARLEADVTQSTAAVEMLVQNGVEPSVWLRKDRSEAFSIVQGDDVFKPILDGVLFRPFDLQMPFIYWSDYQYEGPDRLGRAGSVQVFKMYPPEGSAAAEGRVGSVRIALDDTYDALRRVEMLSVGGEVVSDMKTRSFCKVQGQWIVKDISLKDYQTKDSTSFLVEAAAVGIDLEASFFDPQSEGPLPLLEESIFKVL